MNDDEGWVKGIVHKPDPQEHKIELLIYVVGMEHHDALKLRDEIILDMHKNHGIRKLADMGEHVTLEYRKPEFEWTVPTAIAQIDHGTQGSERTKSALRFIEEYYLLERH